MRLIKLRGIVVSLCLLILAALPMNSNAKMTLEGIRVSDYVSYSHIVIELSDTNSNINVQAFPKDSMIQVRLDGASRGAFGTRHHSESTLVKDMTLTRDNSQRWLVISIPVSSNADLKRIHTHRWSRFFTIDIPTISPNHSEIPTAREIADFKERGGKVVVIDPGHGGQDPGTSGQRYTKHPRLQEKDMVLDIGRRIKEIVEKDPQMMVLMTRRGDYLPQPFGVEGSSRRQCIRESLNYRKQLAKEYMGDIYVSLHLNSIVASKQRSTRGFMIFYLGDESANKLFEDSISDTALAEEEMAMINMKPDKDLSVILNGLKRDYVPQYSKELAGFIADEMKQVPGMVMHSKYMRITPFAVLRQLNMPSVLVEFCYLTHPVEHEFVRLAKNRQAMALALYDGLRQYFFKGDTPKSLPVDSTQQILAAVSNSLPDTPEPTATQNSSFDESTNESLENTLQNLENEKFKQELVNLTPPESEPSPAAEPSPTATPAEEPTPEAQPEEEQPVETPVQEQAPQNNEPIQYTVQSGDTLTSIARSFGSDVKDIKALNKLGTGNVIQPNQQLLIPREGTTIPDYVSPAPDYIDYKVTKGDTLHNIAKRHKTTIQSIKNLNNMNSNTIQLGQILRIHLGHQVSKPISSQLEEYKVRKGDTLNEIARKFGVSVQELKRTNNLRGSNIYPGQVLRVQS